MTADGGESFSCDLAGNLLSASNSVACETFAYDLRDRLTNAVTRIGTNAWEIAWSRDMGGLVTNVAYGAGRAVARTYDLAGRLVAVRDWLGTSGCSTRRHPNYFML
jgi:YD repeat-containing protein